MRTPFCRAFALSIIASTLALVGPVRSDPVGDFYRRSTISIIVSTGAGGAYDLYARVLVQHMNRHIPGQPAMLVQNMAGAGGLRAGSFLFNAAAKDGSIIGMLDPPIVLSQALFPDRANFRAQDFGWIGTISSLTDALGVRADAKVASIADAKRTVVIVGATGSHSQTRLQPALVNALLGTKFKIVGGYNSSNDMTLALERGEIQGRTNPWTSWQLRPDFLSKVNFILQFGPKLPELKGVPALDELVTDPKERAMVELLGVMQYIGRSLAAPPNIPPDRLAALRRAFDQTMKDPEFIAALTEKNLTLIPRTGLENQAYISQVMSTSRETAAALTSLLQLN